MIAKTEGIVLRSRPFSRTSRMITWLTPDYGRVTTVIKGACRPKSFFLGQTDLAYRCELLFYRREHSGAHIAREVYPLDFHEKLRGNWRSSVAVDYICWLMAQVSQPMQESSAVYAHLQRTLNDLENATDGGAISSMLSCFEFTLLDLLGVAPSFEFCRDCTLPAERRKCCRFMLSSGRLGCIHALSIHREVPSSVALTPSLVTALNAAQAAQRHWVDVRCSTVNVGSKVSTVNVEPQTSNSGAIASSPRLAIGIRRFLGLFMAHHLDIPIQPRSVAYAWLDWDKYDKGMMNAECGVRSAECGVRNAECGMMNAECGVRNDECGVRNAECGMRSAECGMRSAELRGSGQSPGCCVT